MSESDPLDLMEPAELVREAEFLLLSALAAVQGVSRALRGESPPPRQARGNIIPFPLVRGAANPSPARGREAGGEGSSDRSEENRTSQ